MVLFTRRSTPKPGKYFDAIKWAKEVADYVNTNYGTNLFVYSQRYGENPIGTIFWVGSFETTSSFEEISMNLGQDEGYITKIGPGSELIVGGTTYDNFLDKQ